MSRSGSLTAWAALVFTHTSRSASSNESLILAMARCLASISAPSSTRPASNFSSVNLSSAARRTAPSLSSLTIHAKASGLVISATAFTRTSATIPVVCCACGDPPLPHPTSVIAANASPDTT